MTDKADSAPLDDLRKRAEHRLHQASGRAPEDVDALSAEQAREALHDLHVHQIELELQNEELRRAQLDLAASQARYFDLYDLAPVGYLTVSESGLISEANLTFTAMLMLDRSRGALLRQPLSRFILPEDQDIYYFHRKQLFESGASQVCELRLLRTDGSNFWAKIDAAPAPLVEGEPVCRIAVSDISRQKQAEASRETLQEQINQAERMETVGRLAGGVAHDLNNSLMPVLGYAELLLDEPELSDLARGFVRQILGAGKRARDLVQQLLAYSHRQMGVSAILDLNETVADLATLLSRTIREDISVYVHTSEMPLYVKGDAAQLEQTIMSLVANAQDAMAGGGALTIDTSLTEVGSEDGERAGVPPPGKYARLRIGDTGIGMSPETRSHIFEPFFTTKEMGRSLGLGLATVYSVVEQHGGRIFVSSAVGEGATFEIYLPLVQRIVQTEGTGSVALAGDRAAETPRRILLVEDDADVRTLTRAILERLGYAVLTAEDGSQALELLEAQEVGVDLVLTDVVMPGMSGRDLMLAIAQTHPQTQVLLMSGHADSVVAHHGVVDEGTNFIQKPFSIEALASKIRGLLDR